MRKKTALSALLLLLLFAITDCGMDKKQESPSPQETPEKDQERIEPRQDKDASSEKASLRIAKTTVKSDPSVRPAISGQAENMPAYDTIVLGYPIWHGQAPRIISAFLESYDFSEKTILPFYTSHSSGIGSSADNLHSLCSDTTEWLEGERFANGTSRDTLKNWLEEKLMIEM